MSSSQTTEFASLINGEWTKSATGRTFGNIHPADTRDIVGRFQASSGIDAAAAVEAARTAFDGWKKLPISVRANGKRRSGGTGAAWFSPTPARRISLCRRSGELKKAQKLEHAEARAMAAAAIGKAAAIGVLETVCVVDDGGYPIVLERMDGARVTGPQIAWNKAFTAAGHKRSTHLFNSAPNGPALPGNEAFGIQWSFDGKFAIFVGGFPIVVDDEVIGGVGLSGGNGEQDIACGVAALQALADLLAPQGHAVLVAADIKK